MDTWILIALLDLQKATSGEYTNMYNICRSPIKGWFTPQKRTPDQYVICFCMRVFTAFLECSGAFLKRSSVFRCIFDFYHVPVQSSAGKMQHVQLFFWNWKVLELTALVWTIPLETIKPTLHAFLMKKKMQWTTCGVNRQLRSQFFSFLSWSQLSIFNFFIHIWTKDVDNWLICLYEFVGPSIPNSWALLWIWSPSLGI